MQSPYFYFNLAFSLKKIKKNFVFFSKKPFFWHFFKNSMTYISEKSNFVNHAKKRMLVRKKGGNMEKNSKIRIALEIDSALEEAIKKLAVQYGNCSKSAVVRQALLFFFANHTQTEKKTESITPEK